MGKGSPLKRFCKLLFVLLILAAITYGAQQYFHILDQPLKSFNYYLSMTNGIIFEDMFWGISTGTVLFIVILIIYPLFSRKVNTKLYFTSLFQGVLSAFVFFISQSLYCYLEKISKYYLLLSLAAVAIMSLILIRIIARKIYKNEESQIEFRTSYLASITAGLIFGALLQLVEMEINFAKTNWHLKF